MLADQFATREYLNKNRYFGGQAHIEDGIVTDIKYFNYKLALALAMREPPTITVRVEDIYKEKYAYTYG